VSTLLTLAEAALDQKGADLLVVASTCDAMRRAGDVLAACFPGRVYALSVPRTDDAGAVASLARGLARMADWLGAHAEAGAPSEGDDPFAAGGDDTPDGWFDYPRPPTPGGLFVVSGPLNDAALLKFVTDLGAVVSGLDCCSGPHRREQLRRLDHPDDFEGTAAGILSELSCARLPSEARRRHLARRLEETGAAAVLYARQSFCDPGAYDALTTAELAAEHGLPFLEIEVGMPFEPSGPLRTRVEAFLEAQLLDADLLDLDGLDL